MLRTVISHHISLPWAAICLPFCPCPFHQQRQSRSRRSVFPLTRDLPLPFTAHCSHSHATRGRSNHLILTRSLPETREPNHQPIHPSIRLRLDSFFSLLSPSHLSTVALFSPRLSPSSSIPLSDRRPDFPIFDTLVCVSPFPYPLLQRRIRAYNPIIVHHSPPLKHDPF